MTLSKTTWDNNDERGKHSLLEEACIKSGVSFGDIERARQRLRGYVQETAVFTSSTMDEWLSETGTSVKHFFKTECFQKTGSFKFRGALNAIRPNTDDDNNNYYNDDDGGDKRPVITHSAGNHGQAVAAAAALFGRAAYVVVPSSAAEAKVAAIKGYDASITTCAPDMRAQEEAAIKLCEEIGGEIVHPFTDPRVMAGQGTVATEFLEQIDGLDAIIASIGGGGLISGIAIAAKARKPSIHIIGAEPLESNSARRSLDARQLVAVPYNVRTIADGVRASVGGSAWEVIKRLVRAVICVSEQDIVEATRMVWERMKVVIEPAAGTAVAAARSKEFHQLGCKRVGIVLCGGNVNLKVLPWNVNGEGLNRD